MGKKRILSKAYYKSMGRARLKKRKNLEMKTSEEFGENGVAPSIGQKKIFILNGQIIDGVLERFDYWNSIEGIKLCLQFSKN